MNSGPVLARVGIVLAVAVSAMTVPEAAASAPVAVTQPRHVADLNLAKGACGLGGVVTGVACGGLAKAGGVLGGASGLVGGASGLVGGASGLLGGASGLVGGASGLVGGASGLVGGASGLVGGASGLVGGTPGGLGGAAGALGGGVSTELASGTINLVLSAISGWVVGGASAVLHETAAALGATTSPQLASTWFSATYWRMAAIAAMLTLPFLFAATVQAALRSDVALLARAAFGYLPLAILSIAIAAPLTTLLLAASDELCGLISAAAANQSAHVLAYAAGLIGGLTAVGRSPFLALAIGLLAIAVAFALWIELLLREAAVYVVVLMLPLAFAALAWPARRIWAVRAIEILIALILSKFAIVAVLSLGGAALDASVGHADVSGLMAGTVLIMLAALSPWALLRFVPITEIATGAVGALRGELRSAGTVVDKAVGHARSADDWVSRTTSGMKRDAETGMPDAGDPGPRDAPARRGDSGPGGDAGPGGDPRPGSDPGPGDEPGAPDVPIPGPSDATAPAVDDPGAAAPAERPWSERTVLELGPNFGDTVVWPHEDAE